MKKVLLRFLIKSLPGFLYDFLILLRQKDRYILKKNKVWKNTGLNKRAWILATGPSIKGMDLSSLKNEDCFSVSNFYLHSQLAVINPRAHFFAAYHLPLERSNFILWLKNADEALPKESAVFLALSDKAMIERFGIFKGREIFYLAMGSRKFKNINCQKLVPGIQTGPQMIINVLMYAGYKEIYLLGCDHNTLMNYGDIVENFYPPESEIRKDATSGAGWLPIVEHLGTQIKVFDIYEEFKRSNPSVAIYNCSPTSWLRFTSIPYINYESLFDGD